MADSKSVRTLPILAVLLALAGTTQAQQFVEETSTRFPSPNPSEFTNQLTIGDLDPLAPVGSKEVQRDVDQEEEIDQQQDGGPQRNHHLTKGDLCRDQPTGHEDEDEDPEVPGQAEPGRLRDHATLLGKRSHRVSLGGVDRCLTRVTTFWFTRRS